MMHQGSMLGYLHQSGTRGTLNVQQITFTNGAFASPCIHCLFERAAGAYMFFCADKRESVKAEHPELKVRQAP